MLGLISAIDLHRGHCNPNGVVIGVLDDLKALALRVWAAVPDSVAGSRNEYHEKH